MYRIVVEYPYFNGALTYEIDADWVEVDYRMSSINYKRDSTNMSVLVHSIRDSRIVVEKIL